MTNELKLNNTVSEQKVKAPKKRRAVSLDRRKARAGYFFVLKMFSLKERKARTLSSSRTRKEIL